MLKQEIIEKITKYFKLTHFEAEKIYDDIFQSIMKGVKEDNITDVSNLGEFLVKLNENEKSAYKKTVEFLPASNLEEEISEGAEYKEITGTENAEQEKKPEAYGIKSSGNDDALKTDIHDKEPEIEQEKTVEEPEVSALSVEDEIKRKRDEIIHKLDPEHKEKYHPLLHVSEGINLNVPKPVIIKDPDFEKQEKELTEIKDEVKEEKKEEIKQVKEEIPEPVTDDATKEKQDVEEITNKSFSDYFSEVKEEQKLQSKKPEIPEVKPAIPPVAVDLHKEIVGEQNIKPPLPYKTVEQSQQLKKQTGNGYSSDIENKTDDNSYYIWYKDSEPNAVDTQTMSYEYELLYQATKEAEYKSKLRIYVTTFILFFSIVLLLLIFSPVIYKYFFTPSDDQSNEQVLPEEQSTTSPENNEVTAPPVQNTAPTQENTAITPPKTNTNVQQKTPQQDNITGGEQKKNTPPAVNNEQKIQETPATQQNNTAPKIEGIVKTGIGWMDEKNKVIYVKLENGKFTIQESAWDSNDKANKRISAVAEYKISGLNGNVFKADLGAKGVWYRARFGEFTTIEEAKQKAEELRNREKMKFQALLMSILLFA